MWTVGVEVLVVRLLGGKAVLLGTHGSRWFGRHLSSPGVDGFEEEDVVHYIYIYTFILYVLYYY